jgi:chromosome segregation ATPase
VSQISAIYGNYIRYKVKSNEQPKPEPIDDGRVDALEQHFKDIDHKLVEMERKRDEDMKLFIEKISEKPSLEIIEPQKEKPIEEISPELKEEQDRMEKLKAELNKKKAELEFKKEQAKMTKEAKEIMKKIHTTTTKMEKEKSELDNIEAILRGETPEEESKDDEKDEVNPLLLDTFKILQELEQVNPQCEGISNTSRAQIIQILYSKGGE